MVKSTGIYQGELNCQLTHGPSGQKIEAEAPKDNHGRGLAFSPTDLTTASFVSCIGTTMAIAAKTKLGFDIAGVRWEGTKVMSAESPLCIVRLGMQSCLPYPRC